MCDHAITTEAALCKTDPTPAAITEQHEALKRPEAHPIDAIETPAAALLLVRDVLSTSHAALGAHGVKLAVTATRVSGQLSALTRAAADQTVSVPKIVGIYSVHAAVQGLVTEFGSDRYQDVKSELQRALARFDAYVDVADAPAGTASAMTVPEADALSPVEHLQLAKHEMAMVEQAVLSVRDVAAGNDRGATLAKCSVLPGILAAATMQAMTVTNRSARRRLVSDVETMSGQLGDVAGWFSETPMLPWNRTLAETFDGENELRRAVGLGNVKRPYTGTVDPEEVFKQVIDTNSALYAQDVAKVADSSASPEVAIEKIGFGIGQLASEQVRAADAAMQMISAPDSSMSSVLMSMFLDLVISSVSAGLAKLASGAVMSALESRAARSLVGNSIKEMSKVEMVEIQKNIASRSPLMREFAVEATKAGMKDVFKKGLEAGKSAVTPTIDKSALTAFHEAQVAGIKRQDRARQLAFKDVVSALAQADLDALNHLAVLVNGDLYNSAFPLELEATMREWQNLKATSALGNAVDPWQSKESTETGHRTERDAKMGRVFGAVAEGVVEVHVDVESKSLSRDPRMTFMAMAGIEPKSLEYFRKANLSLATCGLNLYYRVNDRQAGAFYGALFAFGVGPDSGAQLTSLVGREYAAAQVYASGQPMTAHQIDLVQAGEVHGASQGEMVAALHDLQQTVGHASLGNLRAK